MSSIAAALFIWLEAPVTAFAGAFALISPIAFFNEILPTRLLATSEALTSDGREIVGLAVQVG